MTQPASLFSLRRDTLPPLKDARCERVFEALTQAGVEVEGEDRDFLETVFSAAPYLARLAMRRVDTLARLFTEDAGDVADALITALPEAGADAPDIASLGDRLRRAKADMHLVTALADLAGVWSLDEATSRLSAFADAAVQAGLHGLVREAAGRGRLNPPGDAANPLPGLFVLAMGKMGADELNYSSDIDLVIFYDRDMLEMPEGVDAERVLPRLVQRLVRLLQDPTSEGYVFRTDLRLRPDPGATPTAMQSEAALRYYESIGQNWERAAYIKARVCAGDVAAGQAFLTAMTPFIWRRSLDYAAVDDIRALARQIQSVGDRAQVRAAGHNVKLGRGGIREIEFFAQVPQLVFGGRQPALRVRSPVKALEKLAGEGKVPAAHAEALAADYAFLRRVEHRIQMLEDEATQTLPEDDTLRHRVGILCGFESLDRFDDTVRAVLTRVHATFSEQFSDDESLASDSGSLVFSGVEPTPDTLTTLATLGFSEPASIWNRVNAWLGGRTRATRTQRARELLTRLAPSLLDAMAETGEPDAAFSRFAAFYENLPMGVQPLSLLRNEPELSRELVAILGLAPRIAATLAQRPAKIIKQIGTGAMGSRGTYFGPALVELPSLDLLEREVFGPVLHVLRYKRKNLVEIAGQLAAKGYGLTLGVHSRLGGFHDSILRAVPAGNVYINRNMTGAVVGVQPFGGEGLSGTGPKAGGPHYLTRLAAERTITVNISAQGGDPELLNL